MGRSDYMVEDYVSGRVITFEIAADEQLIGAGLYNEKGFFGDCYYFRGVTWIKCKIPK